MSLLFRSLEKHGFSTGALHGDMDQRSRTMTLQAFRDNKLTLLVASDVAARGLDIPAVSHVFNFDVPIHAEDYVHRIGRTGRAGRSGKAFTLVTRADRKYIDAITALIGRELEWEGADLANLPTSEETEERPRRGARTAREGSSRRGGSGEGRSSRRREPRAEEAETEVPAAVENTAPAPIEDRTPTAPIVEPEAAALPAQAEDARSEPRRDRDRDRRDRGGRGRSEGRAENSETMPVGFGDEIPAFMLVATGA